MAESVILTNLAFAALQFTFTFQMSAYLKILQRYFETKLPADRNIYQQHKVLIQLIEEYTSIFSGQMYYETLVSPILPCGYGLTLIRDFRKNEVNRFDVIQKICCTMLPPFIVCACVQIISTEIEKLHEASYMCNWYEQTPKVRKDLLMLMTRTKRPTTINYRLIFKMDHERLATVLQGLYSYFMLVINFDKD
ncbi:hypothetical protein O3M35_007718 [Rhynocoris fuscipes]|uniref:Uncharacterized protein n=1 Tax=Rhynocoris fuscipes TaxID=488301 RepID=A0AAW1DBZ6_9HEMI